MAGGIVRTLVVAALVLGAVGCGGARYVAQQPNGGVVAIPCNSDVWPTYYYSKAEDLMKKQCPKGYVIDRQEEVPIGSVTTNRQSTDTHKLGPVSVNTQTQNTVETQTRTEFRITYHAKDN
jgi:hypothetical protein